MLLRKLCLFVLVGALVSSLGMGQLLAEEAPKPWSGSVDLGFSESNGNTDKLTFNAGGKVTYKMDKTELLASADIYVSESDNKLDDQKWNFLVRSTYTFDAAERWFGSLQVLTDHDRFADIDVRITPSIALGYWIAKEEGWKWSVEGGLGYESTSYRSSRADDSSVSGVFRTYAEKSLFEKAKISEEFIIIPSFEGDGFRIKSTTEFTNKLMENWDLVVRYVLDYDDEPSAGKSKTDTRIVTGLKYSF